MAFYLILLLTVLNHISFKGSKVLISLFAIAYNRSPPGRSGEAIGLRQTFNNRTEQ